MVNKRQRRRRRERRRARIAYPYITRFLTYCRGPGGSGVHHWIYITRKGDIIFRDHPGADLKGMAAEALLLDAQHGCHGCWWFAARVLHDESFLQERYSLKDYAAFNRKEKSEFSHNLLIKLKDGLLKTKEQHANMRASLDHSTMRPLGESLIYRRELVKARRNYWIDAKATRVQQRMEQYKNAPDMGSAHSSFSIHLYRHQFDSEHGQDQSVYIWDY